MYPTLAHIQPRVSPGRYPGLGAATGLGFTPQIVKGVKNTTVNEPYGGAALKVFVPVDPVNGFNGTIGVAWPDFVDSKGNLVKGHAQQMDPARSTPAKGIYWFWLDGLPSTVKFTWQDLIFGGGLSSWQFLSVMVPGNIKCPPGQVPNAAGTACVVVPPPKPCPPGATRNAAGVCVTIVPIKIPGPPPPVHSGGGFPPVGSATISGSFKPGWRYMLTYPPGALVPTKAQAQAFFDAILPNSATVYSSGGTTTVFDWIGPAGQLLLPLPTGTSVGTVGPTPGGSIANPATSPWVYVGAGAAVLAVGAGIWYAATRRPGGARKNPLNLYYPQPFGGRADSKRFDTVRGAANHGDARYGKGNFIVKFEEARRNPAVKGETSGTFTLRLEERKRRAMRNPTAKGPRVVYRMATGGLVWAVPGGQQIMWAGPGSGLVYGQVLKAGGYTSRILWHGANGQYLTAKQATAAVRAFLAAGSVENPVRGGIDGNFRLSADERAMSNPVFTIKTARPVGKSDRFHLEEEIGMKGTLMPDGRLKWRVGDARWAASIRSVLNRSAAGSVPAFDPHTGRAMKNPLATGEKVAIAAVGGAALLAVGYAIGSNTAAATPVLKPAPAPVSPAQFLQTITDAPTVTQYQTVFAAGLTAGTYSGSGLSPMSYTSTDITGNAADSKWVANLAIWQKWMNTLLPGIISAGKAPVGFPAQLRTDGVLDYATALAMSQG